MSIYSIGQGMKRIDVPMNHSKNNLPLGTVCLFSGYGDHKYVIVKNDGINEAWASYGAKYTLVNVDDYRQHKSDAVSIRHISEKFGIGIYILDEPIKSPDEVLELWEKSVQAIEYAKRAKAEKDEHIANVKENLPAKYPYLIPVKGTNKADRVIGAKNIRIELKRAFPDVKFSVKSDSYSGGNSIDIFWTDGPTTEQVEKITGKYQQGSFDGMTDCYNYEDNLFSDVFGGSKYVMEQRTCSKDAYNRTAKELGYPEAFMGEQGQMQGVDYDVNEMIKRETWKRAF
jgi:hypothetical protein